MRSILYATAAVFAIAIVGPVWAQQAPPPPENPAAQPAESPAAQSPESTGDQGLSDDAQRGGAFTLRHARGRR